MAKPDPKARRTIYDQNYYKAQAMLRDPWFKTKELWLRKQFRDTGCTIPAHPFKTYKDYLKWNDKFWERRGEVERSPEFLAEKSRITGGKKTISLQQLNALDALEKRTLPPLYGSVFREILEHFEIDPNDKGFRDFLERYFFFGKDEYLSKPFSVGWRRTGPKNAAEMLVTIYAHTRKEDIVRHWDWIAQMQRDFFKEGAEKNKAWETFDRDLEIYNAYKRLKKPGGARRPNNEPLDMEVLRALNGKYPDLNINYLRTIISKTRKRLGETIL